MHSHRCLPSKWEKIEALRALFGEVSRYLWPLVSVFFVQRWPPSKPFELDRMRRLSADYKLANTPSDKADSRQIFVKAYYALLRCCPAASLWPYVLCPS